MNNLLLFLFIVLFSCTKSTISYEIISKSQKMNPMVLTTRSEIIKGLSGLKDSEFTNNDIALFVFDKESNQTFWMPDTHFDLFIIFIDEDGLVVGKEKMNHFPHPVTSLNKKSIPRTGTYMAKYVIEIKASSELEKLFQIGEYIMINKKEHI